MDAPLGTESSGGGGLANNLPFKLLSAWLHFFVFPNPYYRSPVLKFSLLAPALLALAVLSACDSSTSSSSPSLPGSPDQALVGTWRSASSAIYGADTELIVLSGNGTFSSTSHTIVSFSGSSDESKCAVSGSWSTSAAKLYSVTSGSCTEISNGVTTNQPVPQALDTAAYTLQGSSLTVIRTSMYGNDSSVYTKL